MQNLKFSITNKIVELNNRNRNIDIEMAVLRKEREVLDNQKTDYEILLDQYNAEHEGEASQ